MSDETKEYMIYVIKEAVTHKQRFVILPARENNREQFEVEPTLKANEYIDMCYTLEGFLEGQAEIIIPSNNSKAVEREREEILKIVQESNNRLEVSLVGSDFIRGAKQALLVVENKIRARSESES